MQLGCFGGRQEALALVLDLLGQFVLQRGCLAEHLRVACLRGVDFVQGGGFEGDVVGQ
jgi:hypothetical protein